MPAKKHEYTISVPVHLFWKVYVPLAVLVAVLALFAGVLFIDISVMPKVVGIDRDMVEVPVVLSSTIEQGREKLYAVGLLTEIRSREYDNKMPEGSIISQAPEAGEKVKKGRRIMIVVSKGKEFAVIPDLRKMTERQARTELKSKGFAIGEVKMRYDEKHPADEVLGAVPECGTTISREMEVNIIVSKGAKPTSTEMPTIVGESITEAKKKIEETGLRVGKIEYRNDPSLRPGTVVSQSVPPGDKVPFEATVNMVVSVIK